MLLSFLGLEFTSQRGYLDSLGIKLFHIQSQKIKATIAERAVKSIMSKLYKYMTVNSTYKWLDILPSIQKSFNDTQSASLNNYSPRQIAADPKKQLQLKKFYAKQFYDHHQKLEKRRKDPLPVGARVRKITEANLFDKSYQPQFSQNIYTISKFKPTSPPQYFLTGEGEDNKRGYYLEELSLVNDIDNTNKKKDLFVTETKRIKPKKLRSGQAYDYQTLYKLKSRSRPLDPGKFVTETELAALKRKKLIE